MILVTCLSKEKHALLANDKRIHFHQLISTIRINNLFLSLKDNAVTVLFSVMIE